MRLPIRDQIATLFVAIALLLYVAWAFDVAMPVVDGTSAVALAILVLGMAASASAVVPGFADLLGGSRTYLAATSVLGLVALIAGVLAVLQAEPLALAALIASTLVLWALSTNRHVIQAGQQSQPRH